MSEEIIIDGVDVSECEHSFKQFDNWVGKDIVLCDCTLGYRCEPKENHCKFYIHYLEQQLKLKEQKCEQLKEQVNHCTRIIYYYVRTRNRVSRHKTQTAKRG